MPAPLPIDTERDGLVSAQLLALANVLDGLPRAACRDNRADVGRLGSPRQRVWTAPALQGCSSDMVGIIGSGCSRVSGLSRGLIAAGLDGRSASRAPIAETNARFVL